MLTRRTSVTTNNKSMSHQPSLASLFFIVFPHTSSGRRRSQIKINCIYWEFCSIRGPANILRTCCFYDGYYSVIFGWCQNADWGVTYWTYNKWFFFSKLMITPLCWTMSYRSTHRLAGYKRSWCWVTYSHLFLFGGRYIYAVAINIRRT